MLRPGVGAVQEVRPRDPGADEPRDDPAQVRPMSARVSGPAPAWRRWIPGSTVILFVFLAVAAFVPLAWLGERIRDRPLWALRVRDDPETVTSAVRDALRDRLPTQLAAKDGPEGLFRRCETLLRVDDPGCWIGVQRSSDQSGTTVLLLPRSRDRRSIDALRARIHSRLESG